MSCHTTRILYANSSSKSVPQSERPVFVTMNRLIPDLKHRALVDRVLAKHTNR